MGRRQINWKYVARTGVLEELIDKTPGLGSIVVSSIKYGVETTHVRKLQFEIRPYILKSKRRKL